MNPNILRELIGLMLENRTLFPMLRHNLTNVIYNALMNLGDFEVITFIASLATRWSSS